MSFKNVSLTWKVLSLLLLLGVASLIGGYYATTKLLDVDELYSRLLDQEEDSAVKLARAGRMIVSYQSGIYQNIVAMTEAANKTAVALQEASLRDAEDQFVWVRDRLPDRVVEIDGFRQSLRDAVATSCREVVRVANESTTAEGNAAAAAQMSKSCQPALTKIVDGLVAFNGRLSAGVDRDSAAATASSIATFRWTSAPSSR